MLDVEVCTAREDVFGYLLPMGLERPTLALQGIIALAQEFTVGCHSPSSFFLRTGAPASLSDRLVSIVERRPDCAARAACWRCSATLANVACLGSGGGGAGFGSGSFGDLKHMFVVPF